MGCNCKGNVSNDNNVKFGDLTYKAKFKRVSFYGLKIFGFLLAILALPIINIAIIWFMFKIVVLNKTFDVKEIVLKILGNSLKRNDDDDDDDELDEYDEDDVVMLDVDEITHNIK
jgi:hypothetical protein